MCDIKEEKLLEYCKTHRIKVKKYPNCFRKKKSKKQKKEAKKVTINGTLNDSFKGSLSGRSSFYDGSSTSTLCSESSLSETELKNDNRDNKRLRESSVKSSVKKLKTCSNVTSTKDLIFMEPDTNQ